MKRLPLRPILSIISICAALIAALPIQPAGASAGTLSCNYTKIPESGVFVTDTLHGVQARYVLPPKPEPVYETLVWEELTAVQQAFADDGANNVPEQEPEIKPLPSTPYPCGELVQRYYREVYGLTITLPAGDIRVAGSQDLYFAPAERPRPGDVVFFDAKAAGLENNHWALVKTFDAESITLFEQNWIWDGCAGSDRVVEYPSHVYTVYTLKSRSGAPIKPIKDIAGLEQPSFWAVSYLAKAAEKGLFTLEEGFTESVTCGEFCQMALNILRGCGMEIEGNGVETALSLGLISNSDGSRLLTREEAACIISRVAAKIGYAPLALPAALDLYTDSSQIAFWAQESVAQVTVGNLMNGLEGYFAPKAPLSKEQAVTIMLRVSELGDSVEVQPSRVPRGGVLALTAKRFLANPWEKKDSEEELEENAGYDDFTPFYERSLFVRFQKYYI